MIRKKIENLPLKHKIQFIIISCVFMISTVAFISIYLISQTYEHVLYRSVSSNLSYSSTEISKYLKQTDTLADMVLSNNTLQSQLPLLYDADSRAERELYISSIYDLLSNYLLNTEGEHISYLSILQDDTSISTYSPTVKNLSASEREYLTHIAKSGNGATIWVTDFSKKHGLFLVRELRESKSLSFRSLGVLIINIDLDTLISQTNAFHSDYDTLSYLLSSGGKQLNAAGELGKESISKLNKNLSEGYRILTLEGKAVFAVHDSIPDFDWDYTCVISFDSINHTISVTLEICILVMTLSIIFILFSSSQISEALTRHFQRLICKMNRFGDDNYTPIEDTHNYHDRKDEIGQLHTNFDLMAQKVDTLIQENYINELLKKEAQLKALESQMDPHFLYNTLDSINWRAKAIDADDISKITTALGKLLRISLSEKNYPFTIRQEMNLVENYMLIQKMRYTQRLQFQIDIPEEYKELQIPKFTIQPLLENAIRYGLEEISEVCFISITAFSSEGNLMIEVKNNGSSFEKNLFSRLQSGETHPHGFGIGILNIHNRLNISYGDPYGLRLYNIENKDNGEEYAVAQIVLPMLPLQKGTD